MLDIFAPKYQYFDSRVSKPTVKIFYGSRTLRNDYFFNFANNPPIQLFICTKVPRVSLNIDKPQLYETYSSQVKRSSFIKLDHNQ